MGGMRHRRSRCCAERDGACGPTCGVARIRGIGRRWAKPTHRRHRPRSGTPSLAQVRRTPRTQSIRVAALAGGRRAAASEGAAAPTLGVLTRPSSRGASRRPATRPYADGAKITRRQQVRRRTSVARPYALIGSTVRWTVAGLAAGLGFEPRRRLRAQRFSRPPRSTAPAPRRGIECRGGAGSVRP